MKFKFMLDHNERVLDLNPEETIGRIVARDFRTAAVFRKYGLDYCCGGGRTLEDACARKGIDASVVASELERHHGSSASRGLPYDEWEPDFLANYIVNTHHRYVTKALPELLALSTKVARVHGAAHPELLRIQEVVEEVAREMTSHMFKEEKVLFPYVIRLAEARGGMASVTASHFGTVRNPINMMEMEHEQVGSALEEVRNLTGDYSLPEGACTSYRVLYQMLEEFEQDLHLHVHLENNILFPKAEALELELGL
jgi:regulator of cell morphogenesis and NO signaling